MVPNSINNQASTFMIGQLHDRSGHWRAWSMACGSSRRGGCSKRPGFDTLSRSSGEVEKWSFRFWFLLVYCRHLFFFLQPDPSSLYVDFSTKARGEDQQTAGRWRPIVENVRECFVWPLTYQWKPRCCSWQLSGDSVVLEVFSCWQWHTVGWAWTNGGFVVLEQSWTKEVQIL